MGFEGNYTVEEDVGVLEVCVVLSSIPSNNCSIDPHIVTINNGKIIKSCCCSTLHL